MSRASHVVPCQGGFITSLRSQSERPSLKESDISIKSVSIPATSAEKIFSNTAKWRNLPLIVDNNSNYLYKPDRIGIEVPIQIKGKIYISNKDFDAFLSTLNKRKGYIP